MKIKSLLIGMLACTALVGCSNEEDLLNGEQGLESRGEKGYMAVNLVNPEMGSRAYKDGEGNEVKVGKIRFYFFGDNGTAYTVSDATENKNFVEVTPTVNGTEDADDNVDKITSARIVINKSKVAPPKSVVAILNADNLKDEDGNPLLGDGSKSLSDLTAIVGQAGKGGIDGTGENEFVMTNSVYKHAVTGETMVATPISVNDIYTKEADAQAKPVNIYVERVLAKVSTTLKKDDLLDTGVDFGGQRVYAKINGWAVTNYNDRSNLFKSLSWTTDPSFTWNAAGDFRSFWAASAAPSTGTKKYSESYKNESTHTSLTTVAAKYCLENTDQAKGKQTQLLVGATLVHQNDDKTTTPLTIARWMGVDYTVEGLKTQLAGALAYDYYYKVSDTEYASITAEYIDFVNPDNTWAADEKRYEVKATLASGKKVYKKNGVDAQGNPVMVEANGEANTVLAKYPVWIWTEGATYYYVAIKHIGTENAIVRNHLYDINVKGVAGFGTPVYNPKEIILPQTPEGVETYIAASVNILSWKVVENNDVVLGQ